MAEGDPKPEEQAGGDRELSEGLVADVIIATTAAVSGGAASAFVGEVTRHVLNRETPPDPPQIELPPGVEHEE